MSINFLAPPRTEQVQEALDKRLGPTGYKLEQVNGQRKLYHPDYKNLPAPPEGCEVFVGRLPRDLYEDELVPPFLKIGPIFELRTMMNFSGTIRGFAFVSYFDREAAQLAISTLNNFQIRKGHYIGVVLSVNNRTLSIHGLPNPFVGNLREYLLVWLLKFTNGVENVYLNHRYPNTRDPNMNFSRSAIVVYCSHRDAAMARRQLIPIKNELFGPDVVIDWADPRREYKRQRGLVLKRNF